MEFSWSRQPEEPKESEYSDGRVADFDGQAPARDALLEIFNQNVAELQQKVRQLEADLNEERRARMEAIAELRRQLDSQRPVEEEWELPELSVGPPSLASWSRSADKLLALLLELGREAPAAVRTTLEAGAADAQEIARTLKASLKTSVQGGAELKLELKVPTGPRKSPLIKKLREQVVEALAQTNRTPEELEQLHRKLVTQLVPEFVEVLEAARRQGDPNLPYFRGLEERLTALIETAGLEEIRPAPGTPYKPAEQNVLKAVRSEEPGLRDQIERCVSRGFRMGNELIKKAEVTVYL